MSGLVFNIDGREIKVDEDKIKLSELAKLVEENYQGHICMGIIDNRLYDLNRIIYKSCSIKFLDTTTEDGTRLYFRGLSLLLVIASQNLFGKSRVSIKHSLGDGLYCEIENGHLLSEDDIANIKMEMINIVKNDYPIVCKYMTNDQAIDLFENLGRIEKSELLKYRKDDLTRVYECDGYMDYFYGYMFPSTGYLTDIDVAKMSKGLIILGPKNGVKGTTTELKEHVKLSEIYNESEEWSNTLGIFNVVDLNQIIEDGRYGEMIRTVEALHEKKIAEIAEKIVEKNSKVILIAAPSSSGKTSFAQRLSTQLKVIGVNPLPISLDDYFIDRKLTPLDEHGKYDYESIYSIDLEKFNEDLDKLINGEEIEKIKFDFIEGKRVYTGEQLSVKKGQPIILEGIHCLNPILTKGIEDEFKFKIYISVITQVNLDDHNRISTSDLRLLRRMVRDNSFRGLNAEQTIEIWPSVRAGEIKNIFPYQEEADIMFNSASVYELSVLKPIADNLLKSIDTESPNYLEAMRLRKMLQYFDEITDLGDIGPTSIIREFIGGSRILV